MVLQNNLFWPPQPAKMEEAPSIQIGGSASVLLDLTYTSLAVMMPVDVAGAASRRPDGGRDRVELIEQPRSWAKIFS